MPLDPLTAGLGVVNTGLQLAGNYFARRNPLDMASNAAARAYSEIPAADGMAGNAQMYGESAARFGPGSAYSRGAEDQAMRGSYRNAVIRNRDANEGLKRQYVADSYRAAQDLGMSMIDSYLQRAAQNDALAAQMGMQRFGSR